MPLSSIRSAGICVIYVLLFPVCNVNSQLVPVCGIINAFFPLSWLFSSSFIQSPLGVIVSGLLKFVNISVSILYNP